MEWDSHSSSTGAYITAWWPVSSSSDLLESGRMTWVVEDLSGQINIRRGATFGARSEVVAGPFPTLDAAKAALLVVGE